LGVSISGANEDFATATNKEQPSYQAFSFFKFTVVSTVCRRRVCLVTILVRFVPNPQGLLK